MRNDYFPLTVCILCERTRVLCYAAIRSTDYGSSCTAVMWWVFILTTVENCVSCTFQMSQLGIRKLTIKKNI